MITNAIVLAGGFGTRLKSVIKDIPKPMAGVAGRPFLQYLLDDLSEKGIRSVILSVGYKWDVIRDYFGDSYENITLQYSIEKEPLGTGGAIMNAVKESADVEFFVFNGDTFFDLDLRSFYRMHNRAAAELSISLKRMENFDRYGVVVTDEQHVIQSFQEKRFYQEGNINAGVYLLKKRLFEKLSFPEKFSFEKDLMERYCQSEKFCGFSFKDYFIDIGIPEDYTRAQSDLPVLAEKKRRSILFSEEFSIDKSWTLFLDRDGVINKKIDNDYVRNYEQYEWLPGIQDSLVRLSQVFGKVIIVSNQQGVGKGLMTAADVEAIHENIIQTVLEKGGRIDRIYYAPQLKDENSPMRKPGIGMAMKAKEDFPEVDFSKSIMVGDSISDMEFGKAAGMKTAFVNHGKEIFAPDLMDAVVEDLNEFAHRISIL